ncbi:MAG TPA: RodZ domain-containing protein [Bacillota bacterium]|nr:RodZ domain-containing protein [Bacillota bacterium]
MKEIGLYLRQVREEKKMSLKDVQEATKISLRYLEAIDRGDFNGIPGEVYRKGFVANYATAIGLDGQEVLQKYHQLKADEEEKERQAQLEAAAEVKKNPVVNLTWSREVYLGIVTVMIGLLIGVSLFAFPSYNQQSGEDEIALSETTDGENNPDANSEFLPAPITVYATFKERVWIQIKKDGSYLPSEDGMTFNPSNTSQLWTAQKELVLKVGNPAGISLTFNNKEQGKLGEAGVVTTLRFTPKGLVKP